MDGIRKSSNMLHEGVKKYSSFRLLLLHNILLLLDNLSVLRVSFSNMLPNGHEQVHSGDISYNGLNSSKQEKHVLL